jgi:hypothetical protein
VSAVLLAVLLGGLWACRDRLHARAPEEKKEAGKAPAREADRDRLQKLLEARRKVAGEEMEARHKEFEVGRGNSDLLEGAARRLLMAELDLAKDREARIAAREKYLETAEKMARLSKARFVAARGSFADCKQAEYMLLTAEIELEREKARR